MVETLSATCVRALNTVLTDECEIVPIRWVKLLVNLNTTAVQ